MKIKKIIIKADQDNLPKIQNIIEKFTKNMDINDNIIENLIICTDEAVSNIICHNYSYDASKSITINLSASDEFIKIEISDSGFPFNPFKSKLPNIKKDYKNFKKFGLGIFLLKKLMDKTEYTYKNNKNNLTLIKYISN